MVAYEQVTAQLNDRMGIIQAALERDQVRMEELHAEERTKQGLMNFVFGVLTALAGFSALAMSGGTALPIVAPMLKIAGVGMYFLGSSNSFEGVQNIILGSIGDGKTVAVNPIRDTIFFGNAELYNHVGQVFSLTTGLFIPIAQTKSIAQGFSQFFWGTVGGLATGQAAYHGTKLLGGNEETAQLMNLLGNFVGGYAASKAVRKFSLNGKTAPKTSITKVQIQEPELLKSSIKTMSDEVYTEIRKMSIKNPESDTMTLGKYEPTIRPDGKVDYGTPGPGSYIKKAGKTTYFDLGEYWNKIKEKFHLDDKQMFDAFNKSALDDAVAQGKTIRFSHDPTLKIYEKSALRWEWDYLKEQHGYKGLKPKGGYWYGIK